MDKRIVEKKSILVICSYFYPDSTIGAIRPFMLSKNLSKRGHRVTVVRSGRVLKRPILQAYDSFDFEIISFLGEESDAERIQLGLSTSESRKKRILSLLDTFVSEDNYFRELYDTFKAIKDSKKNNERIIQVLNDLKKKGYCFDYVFSTYGDLENICAGKYASKLFRCKWIMDFRDHPLRHYQKSKWIWNCYVKRHVVSALKEASICTAVWDGLRDTLKEYYPGSNIVTLRNGFEKVAEKEIPSEDNSNVLKICYTGTIYSFQYHALKILTSCIRDLVDGGQMILDRILFSYAGPNSKNVQKIFKERGLLSILDDKGYISKDLVVNLQQKTDIFLVLAWNGKAGLGVFPAKFYEAIRANKQMLVIIGGLYKDNEMPGLVQEYNLGFCYEEYNHADSYEKMGRFLLRNYSIKQNKKNVACNIKDEAKRDFEYEFLTEKLELIMSEL